MKLAEILYVVFLLSGVQQLAKSEDSEDKDLIITWKEKQKLDEFKKIMEPILPHPYMKEDIYLIRWLRAGNFDLDRAENMLKRNLEWRERQNMDTIEDEDWAEFDERYKYYHHGVDKNGRPVAYLGLGSWNVRRAAISGESEKLSRYLDGAIQTVCFKPRRLREMENKTVTQINLIVDIKGFTLVEQGCFACLPLYVQFVSTYEHYFPGCPHRIILVNVPPAFEIVLAAVRPLFSDHTKKVLSIFGSNKREWEPILLDFVEKDQLPPEIGGTDWNKYEEGLD